MEGILLFDIDGVLFDAEKFGKLVRTDFSKVLNISEDELMRAIADYYAALESNTDFNPKDIVVHIAQRYGVNPIDLDNIFWRQDDHYKEALYPEVETVLKKLSQGRSLGIFSQGFEEFQLRKLEAAGIRGFFNEEAIYIRRRKLLEEAIRELPKDSMVVDNNHEVALRLNEYINAIWINRINDENDPQVRTVHNLKEILNEN